MLLSKLFNKICNINCDALIDGIAINSMNVKANFLFVALSENAEKFIKSAIENGAIAIVSINNFSRNYPNAICIQNPNPHKLITSLVHRFYQTPIKLDIVAITGTNGKSSIVSLCQQIWQLLGYNSASIGTLGTKTSNSISGLIYDNLTTPSVLTIQNNLQVLEKAGVQKVAIEASSHGLYQYRLHNLPLKSAGFSNFSLDHLDYHNSIDDYFNAKMRLFNEILSESSPAILNMDDPSYIKIKEKIKQNNIITYGKDIKSDIQLIEQTPTANGQRL
ncbi:MAG: Mur ligase family protein, partial [Anaplasmataceae bacterium]|nr:Mur ligase family protein [Anaplasmataceae bacterium]